MNGETTSLDIWWGLPADGDKAASVDFGAVSRYLAPRRESSAVAAVYSVTEPGSKEVLWTWDRFVPTESSQRTVALFAADDSAVLQHEMDETFPPHSTGKIRLLWQVVGFALEATGRPLAIGVAGRCVTKGTAVLADDGSISVTDNSFEVTFGTTIALYEDCPRNPVSTPISVPVESGRGLLVAFQDPAGQPALKLFPVQG